ncbi:hypothetical protein C8J57DRAFT_108826 [Mycena rebaudengoi]|nr:hypothetical protein C8J57DRAFT_108826 [Mycena rebaudengoi]
MPSTARAPARTPAKTCTSSFTASHLPSPNVTPSSPFTLPYTGGSTTPGAGARAQTARSPRRGDGTLLEATLSHAAARARRVCMQPQTQAHGRDTPAPVTTRTDRRARVGDTGAQHKNACESRLVSPSPHPRSRAPTTRPGTPTYRAQDRRRDPQPHTSG